MTIVRALRAALVALACASASGCSLDFRRFAPDAHAQDAALDRTTPVDAGRDAEHPDRTMVDAPVDLGVDAVDVVDAVDAYDATVTPDATDVAPVDVGTDTPAPTDVTTDAGCGALLQACCGTSCNGTYNCVGGRCRICGGPGDNCCNGSDCAASLNCVSGTCMSTASCGAIGQPCCSGTCNTGGNCVGNQCVTCGGNGGPCCAGNVCAAGESCDQTSGRCAGCGRLGELCCATGTACSAGTCTQVGGGTYSFCTGGTANRAGGMCTTAGSACADGSLCMIWGFCSSCGYYNELCCNGTACNGGLSCSSPVCH